MDVKCLSLIFICSSLVTAMCSLSLNVIFLMKLLQRSSSYCTLFHYVLVPSHCIISLPFVIIVIWLPNSGSQSLTGHYTHMSMNMKHFLKIVWRILKKDSCLSLHWATECKFFNLLVRKPPLRGKVFFTTLLIVTYFTLLLISVYEIQLHEALLWLIWRHIYK